MFLREVPWKWTTAGQEKKMLPFCFFTFFLPLSQSKGWTLESPAVENSRTVSPCSRRTTPQHCITAPSWGIGATPLSTSWSPSFSQNLPMGFSLPPSLWGSLKENHLSPKSHTFSFTSSPVSLPFRTSFWNKWGSNHQPWG